MNNFFKIAAGILGGVAIIMSLGGMSSKKGDEKNFPKDEPISDDILDGNLGEQQQQQPRGENRGEKIRRGTEEGVRNLQESLAKASNVLGHISIVCNSIVKIFNQDPCVKVTPTTYIL